MAKKYFLIELPHHHTMLFLWYIDNFSRHFISQSKVKSCHSWLGSYMCSCFPRFTAGCAGSLDFFVTTDSICCDWFKLLRSTSSFGRSSDWGRLHATLSANQEQKHATRDLFVLCRGLHGFTLVPIGCFDRQHLLWLVQLNYYIETGPDATYFYRVIWSQRSLGRLKKLKTNFLLCVGCAISTDYLKQTFEITSSIINTQPTLSEATASNAKI